MFSPQKTLGIASIAIVGVGIVSINAFSEDSVASQTATSEPQAESTSTTVSIAAAPEPTIETQPEPEPAPTHVVNAGETLVEISSATLATPDRWLEIGVFNEIENPHLIIPGQVLAIPEEPVDTSGFVVPDMVTPSAPTESRSVPSSSSSAEAPPSQGSGSGTNAIPAHIIACESGGSYTAQNPTSSASGKYQMIDSTFQGTEAGSASGYRSAKDAPPAVQDAAAAEVWNGGRGAGNWAACL